MGTNFYLTCEPMGTIGGDFDETDHDSPQCHIGRRSAAGRYCWDCGISLVTRHTSEVHSARERVVLDECPNCCKGAKGTESIPASGAVELGFAKSADNPRSGVGSCASFTWTMLRHKVRLQALADAGDERKVVADEYGREFTAAEFLGEELNGVAPARPNGLEKSNRSDTLTKPTPASPSVAMIALQSRTERESRSRRQT